MENINCIFDINKVCDNCGECERCDLDPNKVCDSCGKCLEMKNYDTKSVQIDDIIEDSKEAEKYNNEFEDNISINEYDSNSQLDNRVEDMDINHGYGVDLEDGLIDKESSEVQIEYIDDIEGLSELLNDEENLAKFTHEEFPGLISFNNKH